MSDYRNVVDRNNLVELAAYTAPLLLGGEALGGYIAGTVRPRKRCGPATRL